MRRALVCLLGLGLIACGEPELPETQIRTHLEEARQAAVDRDIGVLRAMLSEQYADEQGRTRSQLEDLLRFWLFRGRSLHVWTWVSEVEAPVGTSGRATVFAALASQPIESPRDLSRIRADLYRIELILAAEDDAWRVVSADWRPASLADLDPGLL